MTSTFGGLKKYPNADQVKIHNYIGFEQEATAFAARVMADFSSRGLKIEGAPKAIGLHPGKKSIVLRQLKCIKKQEAFGRDEIFLQVTVDGKPFNLPHHTTTQVSKIPITRLGTGEIWEINSRIDFNESVQVVILEIDNPPTDKHDLITKLHINLLGSGSVSATGAAGANGIRQHAYQLYWD